jgi:hypothetical protein
LGVDLDMSWRPGPQVISETLDGETVIINLDTGHYYSLDQLASWVWTALVDRGATGRDASLLLAGAWSRDAGEVDGVLLSFLEALNREGLILTGSGAPPRALPAFDPTVAPFATPQMQRYDDIQELLLLDPIHEVEEAGWPAQPPAVPGDRS